MPGYEAAEVPDLTSTAWSLPAFGARTSIVTLSVSICKIVSSSATDSPCCLRTAAIVPSVIESPILGTCTFKLSIKLLEVWNARKH